MNKATPAAIPIPPNKPREANSLKKYELNNISTATKIQTIAMLNFLESGYLGGLDSLLSSWNFLNSSLISWTSCES